MKQEINQKRSTVFVSALLLYAGLVLSVPFTLYADEANPPVLQEPGVANPAVPVDQAATLPTAPIPVPGGSLDSTMDPPSLQPATTSQKPPKNKQYPIPGKPGGYDLNGDGTIDVITIDMDLENKKTGIDKAVDVVIYINDTDGDGIKDTIEIDIRNDGTIDIKIPITKAPLPVVPPNSSKP